MENKPNSSFQFPPGFRFHPSDEELIIHYLQNKVTSRPLPPSVIAEIDLYKYNPWELPKKALFGEDEWYFFSPRDRKYPNGARPNRAAASGYWKATGTDKPILTSSGLKNIGVKKALVFYTGRPPKGVKTDWIMNEYRLLDTTIKPSRLKGSMRLDDWVLCRVRQKANMSKNITEVQDSHNTQLVRYLPKPEEARPIYTNYKSDMITDCLNQDCQVLASILAGQALPLIETISSISFQGSNNGNSFTSVYEVGSDKVNSPITVSSMDSYFNPMKGKPSEKNRYENLFPFRQNNDNITEDLLPSKTFPNNVNYHCQSQSQDGSYNPNPSDPIIDFQELNELDFTVMNAS